MASLARPELRILFEETLARNPTTEIAATPRMAEPVFAHQPKTVPARLRAR